MRESLALEGGAGEGADERGITAGRRKGVNMMGVGSGGLAAIQGVVLAEKRPAGFDPTDTFVARPSRFLVTLLSATDFNISAIHASIYPNRPYLVVSLKTGFRFQTEQLWNIHAHNHQPSQVDMRFLNFRNLENIQGEPTMLRLFQDFQFEFFDGGSGMRFGRAKLSFATIEETANRCSGEFDLPCVLKLGAEYGGDVTVGRVKVRVDMKKFAFVRPVPTDPAHWDQHRPQHWMSFPIVPTATGIVRQQFKDLSVQYDRGMIVNPCMYGFTCRWKGPEVNESRFINPIYFGFTMAKKGAQTETETGCFFCSLHCTVL